MKCTWLLGAIWLVSGCSTSGDNAGPPSSMALRLSIPPEVEALITDLELSVLSEAADCNGPDANGGTTLMVADVSLDEPTTLEVSAGQRTFSLQALDGTTPLARACTAEVLVAGETTVVTLTLVEYPSNPDAGVVPPNDDCDGAIELTDGVARVGDTLVGATDAADGSCGDAGADVVYHFTIPAPDALPSRVAVSNAVGFDPVIYVRADACDGTEIACGQNDTDATEVLTLGDLAPGTYYVWVDSFDGGAGTFDILFETIEPPDNEDCSTADPLVEATSEPHSTLGAADDLALSCLASDGGDTVHEFTIAADAAVLITVVPQDPTWNAAISLRNAADCDTTTDLSCVSDRFANRYINVPNLPAGTYNVIVDGDAGDAGNYRIQYDTRAPDTTFGYWIVDTTGMYSSITGGTDITIPLGKEGAGDSWDISVALPFSFPFYGEVYTDISITDDLFLGFAAIPPEPQNYENDCLDDTAPRHVIAPFWDDGVSFVAELSTKTVGSAPDRQFVIEYRDWDIWSDFDVDGAYMQSVRLHQQVVLFENGDIEFRYGPRDPATGIHDCMTQGKGCSATIGIEGRPGGSHDADLVQCFMNGIDDGRVFRFVHPR